MGISTQNIVAYLSTVQRSVAEPNRSNCKEPFTKNALASGQDPYLSILCHRNTPLNEMGSPSQLFMNRRLRTDLTTTHKELRPQLTDHRRAVKVISGREETKTKAVL